MAVPSNTNRFRDRHRRSGGTAGQFRCKTAFPDGAWCLFRAPVKGTRQGKTVLVQLRDGIDPETGQRFTVKRYASVKAQADDTWRHTRITLSPVNPDFASIVLTPDGESDLEVIAELVEVLQGDP